MIPESSMVVCPWCTSNSTLKSWDDSSFGSCLSREQRRAYKHLSNEDVWKSSSNYFYRCPYCCKWSRGNKLRIVDTEDKSLLALGGLPLIEMGGNKPR